MKTTLSLKTSARTRKSLMLRGAVLMLVLLFLALKDFPHTCSHQGQHLLLPAPYGTPLQLNNLECSELVEASGLAPSRLYDNIFWLHNDSGGEPSLYAVSINGKDLGSIRIKGATNRDWEDMATFTLNGNAYILVADLGNNFYIRNHFTLYVIKEPELGSGYSRETEISWQIDFRYENRFHDCESVAVDLARERVLLMTKRPRPGLIYELPLKPPGPNGLLVAQKVTSSNCDFYIKRKHPTSMDLTPDGKHLAVLTRDHAYLYRREVDEMWADTLQKQPQIIMLPSARSKILKQREALCFGRSNKDIYLTTEGVPAQFFCIKETVL